MKKLYVGNLPYQVADNELQEAFSQYGNVTSASVIMDRDTGRSKGFGFVEFDDDNAAEEAMNAMNGQDMGGRSLVVNEARPKRERPAGGGGGGRRSW
jgi:RNA recognition motif-containing protein